MVAFIIDMTILNINLETKDLIPRSCLRKESHPIVFGVVISRTLGFFLLG